VVRPLVVHRHRPPLGHVAGAHAGDCSPAAPPLIGSAHHGDSSTPSKESQRPLGIVSGDRRR
jgi:hypothetical protein